MASIYYHLLGHTATCSRPHTRSPTTQRLSPLTSVTVTGAFQTQHRRYTSGWRIHPGPLQQISTIQSSGCNGHSYLTFLQLYCGLFAPFQGAPLGLAILSRCSHS